MEEFSLKPLSEGLGFYEKPPVFHSDGKDKMEREQEKALLSPELSEDLDLEDSKTYKDLLNLLEKPYLGVFQKEGNIPRPEQEMSSFTPVAPLAASSSVSAAPAPAVAPAAPAPAPAPAPVVAPAAPAAASPAPAVAPVTSVQTSASESCFEKTFYFSLTAYITDAFAASLLFFPPLVSFVFLTQADPLGTLWSVAPQMILTFLFFTQVYCFLCRLFCFETFGESLAKIRLFRLQSQKEVHPFLLFWRFLLICLTGVVFLPLISLVFRKDFVARLTGLYFQKT